MSKIRHIALTTNDLERSAEFYKGAFGLDEISRNDEAVVLTDGYIVFRSPGVQGGPLWRW